MASKKVILLIVAILFLAMPVFAAGDTVKSDAFPVSANLNSSQKFADVAYIYKMSGRVDKNIVDLFTSVNMKVDLIQEKSLPIDFSKYKLIFVGDEDFLNTIPIYNYPSIVSNYYLGAKLGLTDVDGVSKLVSSSPIKGNFEGNKIPVYISAKDNNGIALPAYYLDKDNKAAQLTSYLSAFSSSGEYFGDIISLGNKGILLANGRTLNNNVCFFGIIKSNYWTNESRELFKNCVKFVYDFTQIPVNNSTNETIPIPEKIICSADADCGQSILGVESCSDNDVVKPIVLFKCNNPGTNQSSCSNESKINLLQECGGFCNSGVCQDFKCVNNSQCDDNNANTEDICLSPSSQNSSCVNNIYPVICNSNSECNDGNSSTNDICINSGTKDSSCIYDLKQEVVYIKLGSLTATAFTTNVVLNFSVVLGNSSGVNGYYVSKDGNDWIFVSSPASGYIFDGLSASTDYSFFVRVIDDKNISSDITNISARTLDIPVDTGGSGGSGSGGSSGGSGGGFISVESAVSGGGGVCVSKWICTEWSSCVNSKQLRACYYPPQYCIPQLEKPVEFQDCIEETGGSVQAEEVIADNGGNITKPGYSLITGAVIGALGNYTWTGIIAFLAIVGLLYFYVKKRRETKGSRKKR